MVVLIKFIVFVRVEVCEYYVGLVDFGRCIRNMYGIIVFGIFVGILVIVGMVKLIGVVEVYVMINFVCYYVFYNIGVVVFYVIVDLYLFVRLVFWREISYFISVVVVGVVVYYNISVSVGREW